MAQLEAGKFIVLEGQGMSGKTEQQPVLENWLKERGHRVVSYREPGGTPRGEMVRNEIMRAKKERESARYMLGLFYRARRIGLEEVVVPALNRGDIVVASRFSASSMVYQGQESDLPFEVDLLEMAIVKDQITPTYVLLDVSEDEIITRTSSAIGREVHAFNCLDLTRIELRRNAYLELARVGWSGEWNIVDGVGEVAVVSQRIQNLLELKYNL